MAQDLKYGASEIFYKCDKHVDTIDFYLTHFSRMFHFYTPEEKNRKPLVF